MEAISDLSHTDAMAAVPSPADAPVFLNASRNRCVAGLVDAILDGRHAVALLGEAGVGKTLLLDQAVQALQGRGLTVIQAAAPLPKLLGFQRMIGDAAGVPRADTMDPATLVGMLRAGRHGPLVLAVDDVQTLPVNALAFLWAMVALLERGGIRLQLMLVGQPEFGLTLLDPDLAPLSKALGSTGWVPPLDRDELREYLRHRLASARRWSPGELDELLDRTGGVPRDIDSYADDLPMVQDTGGWLRWRWGLMPLLASLCAVAAFGFVMTRPSPAVHPAGSGPGQAEGPAIVLPAAPPASEEPTGSAITGTAPAPDPPSLEPALAPVEPVRRMGSSWPAAGKGLILTAESGDTVLSLYRRVYRGVTPPPFAEVVAANPAPLRRGSLLVFPPPPNGWANER